MKIQNGKAESIRLDNLDLLDLSYAIRGVARAQEMLLDPYSYPAEEIAARVAYELSFAGNLLAELNAGILGWLADPSNAVTTSNTGEGQTRRT